MCSEGKIREYSLAIFNVEENKKAKREKSNSQMITNSIFGCCSPLSTPRMEWNGISAELGKTCTAQLFLIFARARMPGTSEIIFQEGERRGGAREISILGCDDEGEEGCAKTYTKYAVNEKFNKYRSGK